MNDNDTKWAVNATQEELYIDAVQKAVESEEHFNTFRQNEHYIQIVPHCVPVSEAKMLYNELLKSKDIMSKFEIIKLMDNVGSPELHKPWMTSGRNFKYMYAAKRIKDNFGKNIKSVVEIGVGYGGLCFTLGQYFKLDGYKLVDLECVVSLAKKFLSELIEKDDEYYNPEPPYDLGVSEAAITELDDRSIRHYYDKYLLQCKYLFIRTNFKDKGRLEWFVDMINKDFNVTMQPDNPDEQEKTVLLGWHK